MTQSLLTRDRILTRRNGKCWRPYYARRKVFYISFTITTRAFTRRIRTIQCLLSITAHLLTTAVLQKKIHEAVIQYYSIEGEDTPLCKGPLGREIEFIAVAKDLSDEKIKLARLLKRLIEDDQVPVEDIVLLSPHKEDKSRFNDGLMLDGKLRLSWNMDNGTKPRSNTITCCTTKAFKGLERPVVILIEPEKINSFPDPERLVYVALSRARLH